MKKILISLIIALSFAGCAYDNGVTMYSGAKAVYKALNADNKKIEKVGKTLEAIHAGKSAVEKKLKD